MRNQTSGWTLAARRLPNTNDDWTWRCAPTRGCEVVWPLIGAAAPAEGQVRHVCGVCSSASGQSGRGNATYEILHDRLVRQEVASVLDDLGHGRARRDTHGLRSFSSGHDRAHNCGLGHLQLSLGEILVIERRGRRAVASGRQTRPAHAQQRRLEPSGRNHRRQHGCARGRSPGYLAVGSQMTEDAGTRELTPAFGAIVEFRCLWAATSLTRGGAPDTHTEAA